MRVFLCLAFHVEHQGDARESRQSDFGRAHLPIPVATVLNRPLDNQCALRFVWDEFTEIGIFPNRLFVVLGRLPLAVGWPLHNARGLPGSAL